MHERSADAEDEHEARRFRDLPPRRVDLFRVEIVLEPAHGQDAEHRVVGHVLRQKRVDLLRLEREVVAVHDQRGLQRLQPLQELPLVHARVALDGQDRFCPAAAYFGKARTDLVKAGAHGAAVGLHHGFRKTPVAAGAGFSMHCISLLFSSARMVLRRGPVPGLLVLG